MLLILRLLSRTPKPVRDIALTVIAHLASLPLGRRMLLAWETTELRKTLARTITPGPDGRAIGYLFRNQEPGRSAKDIYRDVFAPQRYDTGYQSQMGQDMFLNRWFFENKGPGFFVDVGAFDGILGSNTSYFERRLHWTGVAFEPNPSAFEVLKRTRSCRLIEGCAYSEDGEVPFLALSEGELKAGKTPPSNLLSMVLDPRHGGTMLSGIPDHMDQVQRTEWARDAMDLKQTLSTVPCHRIDTVLRGMGVEIVDYLSVDVEGAEVEVLRGIDFGAVQVNVIGVEHSERFSEVYDLLTSNGFEYRGLLFFDEVFVHQHPRYTWDCVPSSIN